MRIKSFDDAYDHNFPGCGFAVRSSIGRVGAAGRTGDPAKIAAEQARHARFMASLTKK